MTGTLLHELPFALAERQPTRAALTFEGKSLAYQDLAGEVRAFSSGLVRLGLGRGERVAIYLDKRIETVISAFGTCAAGGVMVPINPLLRPSQVAYMLRDCNVRFLVTSAQRLALLLEALAACDELFHVILVGEISPVAGGARFTTHRFSDIRDSGELLGHRVIDCDMAAILYTSGSTGRPKGVVLSHRNMVAGAKSVAAYLENTCDDVLLAALPLSFDAGFSQLTTAFHVGARVVLLNYLLPRDLLNTMAREHVTGLTAVPTLYLQLVQINWPESIPMHLRYFANTGGRMPLETLTRLRTLLPKSKPYLMYGLTEAFRATYLPPDEAAGRPDSIGKAIPDAEILVLREDGTRCEPNEPGELVQRGALVAMGYWNDPQKTAERFRPLLVDLPGRPKASVLPEIAVFSGDSVREDEEGFLYFIGRRDEMIKTSGYRVSPTEVEEVLYLTQMVNEAAAFGAPHPDLGQVIIVVVTPRTDASLDAKTLIAACRTHLPVYMLPAKIEIRTGPLPRNVNGKIDRQLLAGEFAELYTKTTS